MFSTLRTKALLALTGLAAIGGLVALPGSASAATCTTPFAAANTVKATASNGLISTVAAGKVNVYEYGGSPYVGARYDRCQRQLEVYYGGYASNTTHYNIRLFDGTLIKVPFYKGDGVWHPPVVSAKNPGYHFSVQACNGPANTKNCTRFSPVVVMNGTY